MTRINPESPTIRESTTLYRNRPIIAEMHSSYLIFRVKGMRRIRGMMCIDGALQQALQNQAESEGAEARAGKPRKRQRLSPVKVS